MEAQARPAAPAVRAPSSAVVIVSGLLLLTVAGAAILWKAAGAMKALARAQGSGTLAAKARWIPLDGLPAWSHPLVDTLNYFSWIAIALAFGVVIGSIVRAAIPSQWLTRIFARSGPMGVALGAAAGVPLMLCSCCISPVFDGAYSRTRKLGPSLAMMFAAPGLNPAALAITFFVFPPPVAVARLLLSLVIVLGVSAALGAPNVTARPAEACVVDAPTPSWRELGRALLRGLGTTSKNALPVMVVGALVSALVVQWVPAAQLASAGGAAVLTTLIVAAVATLIALPTFGEIPIALALSLAGAPTAAVLAVLVAGPIINLPSLMVVRQSVSTRVAAAVGVAVFAVTFAGSELASVFISR